MWAPSRRAFGCSTGVRGGLRRKWRDWRSHDASIRPRPGPRPRPRGADAGRRSRARGRRAPGGRARSGAQAAAVRLRELGAADAAQGAFDLVGDLGLDWSTERATAKDTAGAKTSLDTQRLTLDAALVQPLVWGTTLRAGWVNRFTATDNPFRNCVPGVASDQCFESRLELSVTQPLLRGAGRAVNTLAEARVDAEAQVARAQRRVTVAGLVESVATAWAELALAEADVRIRERALSLAQTQYDSSRRQVEGGRLAPVDLAVVEQAVAEREQALFVATQRVEEKTAELATRLGTSDFKARLPEPPTWDADIATTLAAAEATNPELIVAERELGRQRAELPGLEDQAKPKLDLGLTAAQSGLDEELGGAIAALPDNESSFYGASLSMTFPFQNRRAEGELAQARLGLERAELTRAARVQEVRLAADAALRALRTAEQAQVLAERVAGLAEKSLAAEQRRLELGRATQLDVLQVQQEAAEAELAVERARADRVIAGIRLRRLTGRLLESFALTVD
ncbi:MAG: TolC family protein [bacterium]